MSPTLLASLVTALMVSRRILSVAAAGASAFVFSVPAVVAEPVHSESFGPSAFTAPGAFPTSLYKSYFNSPTATSVQPQPVISDPVSVSGNSTDFIHSCVFTRIHSQHKTYPFDLTNPATIPKVCQF